MSNEISVLNEQIREKATLLSFAYLDKLGLKTQPTEEQQNMCEEFIVYCSEHKRFQAATKIDLVAEEIYMIGFLFWGNTENQIIPYKYLDLKIKNAYWFIAEMIKTWTIKGELPGVE